MTPAWRWQHHSRLGSTQDAAIAAAAAGDPGRLAILTDIQEAGRGSRGRGWHAPPGNLNLSVLLRPGGHAVEPGFWALLAGVVLHVALAPYAPGLMLKWPNDVLMDGAKLGGILIDSRWGDDPWVVIGLGANLAAAPVLPDRATACLPPPAPAAPAVAEAVLAALDRFATCPMPALVEAWLARAHPVGALLEVCTPRRRLTGAFAGLTLRGELKLRDHADPISSAEVFL